MRILDAVCKAAGWQGGTIHHAIDHCREQGKRGTLAYKLGLGEKSVWTDPRYVLYDSKKHAGNWEVPINGFSYPKQQVLDYVLGLSDAGLFDKQSPSDPWFTPGCQEGSRCVS